MVHKYMYIIKYYLIFAAVKRSMSLNNDMLQRLNRIKCVWWKHICILLIKLKRHVNLMIRNLYYSATQIRHGANTFWDKIYMTLVIIRSSIKHEQKIPVAFLRTYIVNISSNRYHRHDTILKIS